MAYTEDTPPRSSEITLNVNVLDVNDNRPIFTEEVSSCPRTAGRGGQQHCAGLQELCPECKPATKAQTFLQQRICLSFSVNCSLGVRAAIRVPDLGVAAAGLAVRDSDGARRRLGSLPPRALQSAGSVRAGLHHRPHHGAFSSFLATFSVQSQTFCAVRTRRRVFLPDRAI